MRCGSHETFTIFQNLVFIISYIKETVMLNLIKWFKWLLQGKPFIKYKGFNCGCCGKWWDESFEVPAYKSEGKWWDTINLCPKDKGCG